MEGCRADMGASVIVRERLNLGPAHRVPPGEGRRFQVGDVLVAVFRTRAGRVFATQDRCPHKAGPLADGIVGAGAVVCPLHAHKFDLATGRPIGNGCAALKVYAAWVSEQGDILVDVDGSPGIEGRERIDGS